MPPITMLRHLQICDDFNLCKTLGVFDAALLLLIREIFSVQIESHF